MPRSIPRHYLSCSIIKGLVVERDMMIEVLGLVVLFVVKVFDNILNTTKSIMIQRNKPAMAGIVVVLSQIIYFTIVKKVVTQGSNVDIAVVSMAAGLGTFLAVKLGNKYSKDKLYVHIVMSDDKEGMIRFREYLVRNKVTSSTSIGYTLDWEETLEVTVYAETKDVSKLVDRYIEEHDLKAKRIIQK